MGAEFATVKGEMRAQKQKADAEMAELRFDCLRNPQYGEAVRIFSTYVLYRGFSSLAGEVHGPVVPKFSRSCIFFFCILSFAGFLCSYASASPSVSLCLYVCACVRC